MNPGFRASTSSRATPGLPMAVALAAGLAFGMGAVGTARAQAPAAPMTSAPTPTFSIKGFKVTGENPLGDGETSRVLAPFLRSDATIDTLQKATVALETALRDRGYGLHRVALPPQEVGDTVNLVIVKFAIGKVTIEGRERFDEGNIRRSIPELKEGATPNFKRLAVETAIANESQGKQIQVSLKESDEPDKIDANVTVKENKPWNFGVNLSNSGAQSSGRDRFTVSGGHSNLWNLDHQLVAAYTTSINAPSAVKQIGLSYRAPFYNLGGVLGASYTKSDVLGNFGAFTSTGAGRTMGLNYSQYLPPDGGYRGFVTAGMEDKLFNVTQINGIPVPGQVDRRSRPFTIGYTGRKESDTAFWTFNTDFVANTPGGTGNDLASYQTEDPRISTTRFKALRVGGSYTANIAGNWLWNVRGQGQYSPDALIAGEQFGLGGSTSVRGASERPIAGDSGLLATLEVTTPEVVTGLRLVGFFDTGVLGNNSPNGTTKPGSDRLSGAGLGLRYTGPYGLSFTADYGYILNDSVVPLTVNSSAPRKGDTKIYMNLSVRF